MWVKEFHDKGMLLQEKYKGILWWRKRYYFGWSQNVHNMHSHGFLLDADWFDTLTPEMQHKVYEREVRFSYRTSKVRGGNPELV